MDYTQVNLIQLQTFEPELDFAEHIQYTDVRIEDLLGNVISATVGMQPEYELPSSTGFGQFQKFGKFLVGAPSSPATPK